MVYSSTLFDFKEVEHEKLPSTTNWPLTKEPASKIHPDPPFDFARCICGRLEKRVAQCQIDSSWFTLIVLLFDSLHVLAKHLARFERNAEQRNSGITKFRRLSFALFLSCLRKRLIFSSKGTRTPPFHSEYYSTSPTHHVLLSTFIVHPTYPPSNLFFLVVVYRCPIRLGFFTFFFLAICFI